MTKRIWERDSAATRETAETAKEECEAPMSRPGRELPGPLGRDASRGRPVKSQHPNGKAGLLAAAPPDELEQTESPMRLCLRQ